MKNHDHVVTVPSLPNLADLLPDLETIWSTRQLTNNGPFARAFEQCLRDCFDVPHVSLTANATIGLIAALHALDLSGNVITTPFSFPATTHAIRWAGLDVVFADIDPNTGNLDPDAVRAAMTDDTSAVLPVHCFGNACPVDDFQSLAEESGVRIIYDAAAAFGTRVQGGSVFRFGDLSVISFHATKVMNTLEGGAIISHSQELKQKLDEILNNGIDDNRELNHLGLNGKMNELSAAIGRHQLPLMPDRIRQRRDASVRYERFLKSVPVQQVGPRDLDTTPSYSYFPIRVNADRRDAIIEALSDASIMAKTYFDPLISTSQVYSSLPSASPDNLPRSHELANEVVCLPLHEDLTEDTQIRIVEILAQSLR